MSIDLKTIKHIAKLSRISIDDKKAKELADENGWFYARQFENEANANIHELTTGQEIVSDFKETSLDYWVSGYGTGGTFSGVARTLRESMPETKLIMAEPDVAPLVIKGKSQLRTDDGAPASSHPDWNPHPISSYDVGVSWWSLDHHLGIRHSQLNTSMIGYV